MLLQPISIRNPPTKMPVAKYSRLSIIPFSDFLGEIRKQMKGTSRVTSRYESNEILRGRARFAISMILGVRGMLSPRRMVTVSRVVPSIAIRYSSEVGENLGTPSAPPCSLLVRASWEPSPTSAPDRMSRSVDIFLR